MAAQKTGSRRTVPDPAGLREGGVERLTNLVALLVVRASLRLNSFEFSQPLGTETAR